MADLSIGSHDPGSEGEAMITADRFLQSSGSNRAIIDVIGLDHGIERRRYFAIDAVDAKHLARPCDCACTGIMPPVPDLCSSLRQFQQTHLGGELISEALAGRQQCRDRQGACEQDEQIKLHEAASRQRTGINQRGRRAIGIVSTTANGQDWAEPVVIVSSGRFAFEKKDAGIRLGAIYRAYWASIDARAGRKLFK